MKFSLKILFAAIFFAAVLCAGFDFAPTATLSVILLGSLPLLVFTALQMATRLGRRLILLFLGPFALYAFFLGIVFGPWAAITVAPKELGFVKFRSTVMVDFLNWSYAHTIAGPWMVLDPEFESPLSPIAYERLENYQADWMALVDEELK